LFKIFYYHLQRAQYTSTMANSLIKSQEDNTPILSQLESNPVDQFLTGQLSERTRRAYQADLHHFFSYLQIESPTLAILGAIRFREITEFRNHLAERGYKRTSINRKLSSLKAFFKMLVAAGHIEQNPADSTLVRGFKVDDTLSGKAIAPQALKSILHAIENEEDPLARTRDTAIFQLLTYGGLRRSEVANMSWENMIQEGIFHVLQLPDTKSGTTQEIKLQDVVVHYIEIYRQTLVQHGYTADRGGVFISLARNKSHGKRLTDQSINLIVKKYARKAGVAQNITAHMFRHTCCTLAIEGGAKPQQVQSHLRHKDLKTTMRYYENRDNLLDNASDYIKIS
jgi:site-specific recombinase XerD